MQSRFPARILALATLMAAPHAGLAADDPAETACHAKDTTVAIMECLGGLTQQWDKRLNAAYRQALAASESPARKQALTKAQRAWVAYRDANCTWYDVQEGTIREVEAAGCMLAMTRDRTLELKQGEP